MKNKNLTNRITLAAMFAAIAFIMAAIGHFIPIPKVAGILSYDPKDSVIVISGFILGPWFAIGETLIVSFIEMLTISATGIYGFIMNAVSTLAFALPPVFVYKAMRSKKGAVAGLLTGVAAMAGIMVLWNYIITPIYMNIPREAVVPMLWSVFLPFNAIKGGLNAALAMLLYAPIMNALHSGKVLETGGGKKRFSPVWTVGALAFFVTLVLLLLALAGVI